MLLLGEASETALGLRDALAMAGLSFEAAAGVLGVSAARVAAKCDPGKPQAPVTLGDVLRLARAGGRARDVARVLHALLGAALEDDERLPAAAALPVLGGEAASAGVEVMQAVQTFCTQPGEATRLGVLRAVGRTLRVMTTLRGMFSRGA